MTSDSIDWTQEAELDSDKEYRALLRSVRWTNGFGLLFVQCSPAEGIRLIAEVREDLPSKKIEVLTLNESIDNLFDLVDALPNKDQIDALFIQGIEHSLYEYERTQLWDEPNERINYSEKGVPRLLGHLNLARERFRDNFKICFIFLVPKFALKYLIRRAPDFFDWRSGVLEFAMDAERLQQELQQICIQRDYYKDYLVLNQKQRREKILRIQALVEEPKQTFGQRASLYLEQGRLYLTAREYEDAISSCDKALAIEPENARAWFNRGLSLDSLGRYEDAVSSYDYGLAIEPENARAWFNRSLLLDSLGRYEDAVSSYDKVLVIEPKNAGAWFNRGLSLDSLGRYEDAVSSYDKVLALEPDNVRAWLNRGRTLSSLEQYEDAIISFDKALDIRPNHTGTFYNKAYSYGLQGEVDEAIEQLKQAIALNPKYREIAKNNSDFDSIRNDDRFKALINGGGPRNE